MIKASFRARIMQRLRQAIDPVLPSQGSAQITSDANDYWNGSDRLSDIQDWSHWKGKGRWSEQLWSELGAMHFQMYRDLCLLTDTDRPIASMVEWGTGGGANVTRFSSECETIFGIDISAANLRECHTQLAAVNFSGFHEALIDAAHPEASLDLVPVPVDLFLCTAVYQHFPSKEYGERVTQLAFDLLRDKGIALIQTRYDDGSMALRPKRRNYHDNAITFTSYAMDEFWELTRSVGFTPLALVLDPSLHYAYYYLAK